jgi:hypothetical protein
MENIQPEASAQPRIAQSHERGCITESLAIELNLSIQCIDCLKIVPLLITTVVNGSCRCKNHKDDTHRETKYFTSRCKSCKSQKVKTQLAANDAVRNKNRIRQQKDAHRDKLEFEVAVKQYYAELTLEYGQCYQCKTISLFFIEWDHEEMLMVEDEKKEDSVSQIHNLKKKIDELKKTYPLCVKCHHKKSQANDLSLLPIYNGTAYVNNTRKLIENAKSGGCVACWLHNPNEEEKLGGSYFHLVHIDSTTKSDWFKNIKHFSSAKSAARHKVIAELELCHTLCKECHILKNYLEHEQTHSLKKHNWLKQHHSEFIIWYKDLFKNNHAMLAKLDSPRSQTDEFVPIITNIPYKPVIKH